MLREIAVMMDHGLAPSTQVDEAAQLQALVERILALHWGRFGAEPGPDTPPPIAFDAPGVAETLRDPRLRFMLGRDRHATFWLREPSYLVLLMHLALRSSWLADVPVPIGTAALARLCGLSDRMVRVTLQRALATGDLVALPHPAGRGRRVLDLSPGMVAAIAAHRGAFLDLMAERQGRAMPGLAPEALREVHRLLCFMQVTAWGPPGELPTPGQDRRSLTFLMLDLLLDGQQPLAALVAVQAERLQVTPMTIRNTVRRAVELGWLTVAGEVSPTPLAQMLFGRAVSILFVRWSLALDAMEILARRPDLAPQLRAALPPLPD